MAVYINGNLIEPKNFPGGEVYVFVPPELLKADEVNILAYIYNSDDIMRLFLTVDACRRVKPSIKIEIHMPYLPYGRQDRLFKIGEGVGVEVIKSLLKTLDCEVIIRDAHSQASLFSSENNSGGSISYEPCTKDELLPKEVWGKLSKGVWGVIFPDQGAEHRYGASSRWHGISSYVFHKRRTSEGGIVFESAPILPPDMPMIVIDDICDGGGTFIALAQKIRETNTNPLHLAVTHGIFSQGLDILRPYYDHVYCYHTWLPDDQIDPSFLTVTIKKEVEHEL